MAKKTEAELKSEAIAEANALALNAVNARIADVEKEIVRQMYAPNIDIALDLAGSSLMRHEQHTITLSDERAELSFLKLRKKQLEAEVAKAAQ